MPYTLNIQKQELTLNPQTFGTGPVHVIFVGPMSIYKGLFPTEFSERFTIHGFSGFPWEDNAYESIFDTLTMKDLVDCYVSLKNQVCRDNKVVWCGHSALSVLAMDCAIDHPELSDGVITFGMPILRESSDLNAFLASVEENFQGNFKTDFDPAITPDPIAPAAKWQRESIASHTHEQFCATRGLPEQVAGFISKEGHTSERRRSIERCFFNPNSFKERLDSLWNKLSLKARGFAYQVVAGGYSYEKFRQLKVPLLSIAGIADGVVPCFTVTDDTLISDSPFLSKALTTHCMIEDAAHMPFLENPTAVLDHMDQWFEKTSILDRVQSASASAAAATPT